MNFQIMKKSSPKTSMLLSLALLFGSAVPSATVYADSSTPPAIAPAAASVSSGISWNDPVGLLPSGGGSSDIKITPDGRYIAYAIDGSNRKLSILDRQTGVTNILDSKGVFVNHFSMSDNAKLVAYSSYTDDSKRQSSSAVFVYDRDTDKTDLISQAGGVPVEGDMPAISGDGRFVAFQSTSRLTADDQDDVTDIYVYDVAQKTLERISKPFRSDPENLASWDRQNPSISADGRFVAFDSLDRNLVPGDGDYTTDIFVFDRSTKSMSKVNVPVSAAAGKTPTTSYINPSLNADGSSVAFEGKEGTDSRTPYNVFVANLGSNTVEQITYDQYSATDNYVWYSRNPKISPDGQYIAYNSYWENDVSSPKTPETISVADLQHHTLNQVAFTKPPFNDLYVFEAPAISNGAKTVVFTALGHTSQFWNGNIFAADRSDAFQPPVWPAGSQLLASNLDSDHVTLSWPTANDPTGIKGYQIYRNNLPIDFVNSPATQLTMSGLLPDTDYDFKVEAVNSSSISSSSGPAVHVKTPKDTNHAFITWSDDRMSSRQLGLNSTLTLNATGPSGSQTVAQVVYKTWFDENGRQLTAPRSASANVSLTAASAEGTTYTGTMIIPEGMTELTSIQVTMNTGAGSVLTADAPGLPVAVSGGIRLQVQNPANIDLSGAQFQAWSEGLSSASLTISGSGPYILSGLLPGDKYQAALRKDSENIYVKSDPVQIQPGLFTPVTMAIPSPAALDVFTSDMDGTPVQGVTTAIWDESGQTYITSITSDNQGHARLEKVLKAGSTYQIKTGPNQTQYESPQDRTLTVQPGVNQLAVQLTPRASSALKGTITDPDGHPVMNAAVTVTQTDPETNQSISKVQKTDINGQYVFPKLLPVEASVQAADTSLNLYTDTDSKVQLERLQTSTQDIQLKKPAGGILQLNVNVKPLGKDWRGPLDLEQNKIYLYIHSRTTTFYSGFYGENSIKLKVQGPVTVCVSTFAVHAPESCQTADLQANSNTTLDFRFEEQGALLKGTVTNRNLQPYRAIVYSVSGPLGELSTVATDAFYDDQFQLWVPSAGTYRLDLLQSDPSNTYTGLETHMSGIQLSDKQAKDLGAVTLLQTQHLSDSNYSNFSASTNRIIPDSTINLQAQYSNKNDQPVTDAHLVIPLPVGMEPVSDGTGRIILNGTDVTSAYSNHVLDIPIGTIAGKQNGRIGLQIKVSPEFNQTSLYLNALLQGNYEGKSLEQSLGTVYMQMPMVTLEVPDPLTTDTPVFSGYAPPGSTVSVYDGSARIGSATASSLGLWKAQVALVDLGSLSVHELRATADAGGQQLQSPENFVQYDPGAPQLVSAAMAQINPEAGRGNWVTIDPNDGVARMPYVAYPGAPFQFELKFTNPDKVKDVRIYLDGQSGPPVNATYEDGLFKALVPTTYSNSLGSIYLDYDTVNTTSYTDRNALTIDTIRASLPEPMRDFEVESNTGFQLDNGRYAATTVLKFPEQPNVRMTVKTTINPNASYTPTNEEITQAEASGNPIFNAAYDSKETDTSITNTITGFVRKDQIMPPQNKFAGVRALSAEGSEGYKAMAEFSMEVKSEVTGPKDQISDVKGLYNGYKDYAEKINRIMWAASGGRCFSENVNFGTQALKALAVTIGGEIAKTALSAWQGAMSLEGPSGFAAGFLVGSVSDNIDNYVNEQINEVGSGLNACDGVQPKQGYDYNEWNGLPPLKLKRWDEQEHQRKLLETDWIYDPSGYVYEAVKSNRVSGVKATALYQDPDTKKWTVWNAAPYAQTNPLTSDAKGLYGWDVPKGKWKVQWEKEGYETATSAELDVPPPQTAVNGEMVSFAPPVVDSVKTVANAVDITFSKYLKTSVGLADAVTLTDSGGNSIAGSAQFVDSEQSPEGESLSRTVRFTPDPPIAVNGSYLLHVAAANMISYSGIPMAQDYDGTVTTSNPDAPGPVPVSAEWESGNGLIKITFDKPIAPKKLDISKWQLSGQPEAFLSAATYSPEHDSKPNEVLLTLAKPISNPDPGVALTLIKDAVEDENGNGSAGTTIQIASSAAALSGDARLSRLTVSEGTLSPAFAADNTDYTLTVPTSTTEVQMTANASAPKAKLFIQGLQAASGSVRTVAIPSDGIINIRVQAEDPNQTRLYTIKVVRSDQPAPPPNTGGSAGSSTASGDSHDLGSYTSVNRTTGDGHIRMQWDIPNDAVQKAVLAGSVGDTYYVQTGDQADTYAIQIPGQVLRALIEKKDILRIKTASLQVQFSADSFSLPSDTDLIVVTLDNPSSSGPAAQWLKNFMESSGSFKPVSGIFSLKIAAITGNRSELLHASDAKGIKISLKNTAESSANLPPNAGIYQVDAVTGELRYVPSRISTDAKQIDFGSAEGGTYAALDYESSFKDIRGHWAQKEIDWMAARLYVHGYSPTSFQPDKSITRAEFTVMLAQLLGLKVKGSPTKDVFSDVPAGSWYSEAVAAAVQAGLINGTGNGQFKPYDIITREQMIVIIWRAYNLLKGTDIEFNRDEQTKQLQPFEDKDQIDGWAKSAIAGSLKVNLVHGDSAVTLDPKGTATRAQSAVILQNFAESLHLSGDLN